MGTGGSCIRHPEAHTVKKEWHIAQAKFWNSQWNYILQNLHHLFKHTHAHATIVFHCLIHTDGPDGELSYMYTSLTDFTGFEQKGSADTGNMLFWQSSRFDKCFLSIIHISRTPTPVLSHCIANLLGTVVEVKDRREGKQCSAPDINWKCCNSAPVELHVSHFYVELTFSNMPFVINNLYNQTTKCDKWWLQRRPQISRTNRCNLSGFFYMDLIGALVSILAV